VDSSSRRSYALVACGTARSPTAPAPSSGFRNAEGPYATLRAPFTALPQAVQLEAERDVLSLGETPRIMVYADAPNPTGGYYETSDFTVVNPDGTKNDGPCDAARGPHGSRGFAVLNFECHPVTQLGVYTVKFEPARSGIAGEPVEISLRVINAAPKTPPAPSGWTAVPLWNGTPQTDCYSGFSYVAALDHDRLVKGESPRKAKLPALLANRMAEDHARTVKYVFEADDGWIVMFDHGEFGGGIEWFARAGGQPRSVFVGQHEQDEFVPQNVNRALAADGVIYVLQGIAHMGTNESSSPKSGASMTTSAAISSRATRPSRSTGFVVMTGAGSSQPGPRSGRRAKEPRAPSFPACLRSCGTRRPSCAPQTARSSWARAAALSV